MLHGIMQSSRGRKHNPNNAGERGGRCVRVIVKNNAIVVI